MRDATWCRICRKPNTRSGCAAMAWSIRPRSTASPAQHLNLTAVKAPNDAAAAQYYPAIYWYAMLEHSGSEPVRRQERHPGEGHPDRMADHDQEPGLHRLPSDRAARDPHHSGGIRHVQVGRRRMDAARAIRTGSRVDGEPACRPARRRAVQIFRRLDRSGRQRRTAGREATAAAGRRTQCRDHYLGMGRSEEIPA